MRKKGLIVAKQLTNKKKTEKNRQKENQIQIQNTKKPFRQKNVKKVSHIREFEFFNTRRQCYS